MSNISAEISELYVKLPSKKLDLTLIFSEHRQGKAYQPRFYIIYGSNKRNTLKAENYFLRIFLYVSNTSPTFAVQNLKDKECLQLTS